MEWLESNLAVAFPLADGAPVSVAAIFADGWVATRTPGQLTLDVFDPQAFTNAHVRVVQGLTVLLETFAATATPMGSYTVLEGTDAVRGSSFRFIVDTAAAQLFAGLPAPQPLAGEACVLMTDRVTTLNGLDGDVRVLFDKHIIGTMADGRLVLSASEPADRVDCTTADCEKLFSLEGAKADVFGSLALTPDGCYRLVPHPSLPNTLLLYNHCVPCLDCADVDLLSDKFVDQAEYLYQLGAIHHDQFNRYQRAVAEANRRTEETEYNGAILLPCGTLEIAGRAFSRPYFSQVAFAVINSSPYGLSINWTPSLLPAALASQIGLVADSYLVQRFGPEGQETANLGGVPGSMIGAGGFGVAPGETVTISFEMQRLVVDDAAPSAGVWTIDLAVTFSGDCGGSTPAPVNVQRTFPVSFGPATPATEP